eukprot:jgi/Mesvir1/24249/Mv10953-RA.1
MESEIDALLRELNGAEHPPPIKTISKVVKREEARPVRAPEVDGDVDIDKLLSEISFSPTHGKASQPLPARVSTSSGTKSSAPSGTMEKKGSTGSTETGPSTSKVPQDLLSKYANREKCTTVFIGPVSMKLGRTTGLTAVRCCDKLRCTKCDFRVLNFDGKEWFEDVEYLFFRNCIPDEEKLSKKLRVQPGVRAMACQCTWASVKETTEIGFSSNIRWVCGGH